MNPAISPRRRPKPTCPKCGSPRLQISRLVERLMQAADASLAESRLDALRLVRGAYETPAAFQDRIALAETTVRYWEIRAETLLEIHGRVLRLTSPAASTSDASASDPGVDDAMAQIAALPDLPPVQQGPPEDRRKKPQPPTPGGRSYRRLSVHLAG